MRSLCRIPVCKLAPKPLEGRDISRLQDLRFEVDAPTGGMLPTYHAGHWLNRQCMLPSMAEVPEVLWAVLLQAWERSAMDFRKRDERAHAGSTNRLRFV